MSVDLKRGGVAAAHDISSLEKIVGQPISEPVKQFLNGKDGAEPAANVFSVTKGIDSGVNEFIPCREIPTERANIENISQSAYPIAWAEGGNYVLIDEGQSGAVLFWDHENPEHIMFLSKDMDAFLASLAPFDPASVKLAPGQVKAAWIDPDFLKGLTEEG